MITVLLTAIDGTDITEYFVGNELKQISQNISLATD